MAETWEPEPELLESLDHAVPDILASQKENGQFGTEPWISTDQNVMFPLAVAWHLKDSKYHHDAQLLDAIVRGGYACIEGQDENGMFLFKKKDYSEWGPIYQPWIYSRWIRAYWLVKDAMPKDARNRWEEALLLGYRGISEKAMQIVHNIPTHHAMGLYCAGLVFDRQQWREQSKAFMAKVVARQSPNGWWPEHEGPVVAYNFVYSEALGVYYSMSGDTSVLDALERASRYHANLTYPDGSAVETLDGRNPYQEGVRLRGSGFSHTPIGRGYLMHQHARYLETARHFPADYAAHLLLHGGEGPVEPTSAELDHHVHRMGQEALIVRNCPWFFCISAFCSEIPQVRWGQDRQNFVSVFHDNVGLIIGGGNTKLQPLWSNFTVGDTSLLRHTPGDTDPEFSPRKGLLHVPDNATYMDDKSAPGLLLNYGEETCNITLTPKNDTSLTIKYEATANSGDAVEGHVTLLPDLHETLDFGSGESVELGEEFLERSGESWIEHRGWRLYLPEDSRVVWPALPHNPYRKGGESTPEEGRIVVVLPFSNTASEYEMTLEIL
ncbi:MAG: hypothetical protein ACLFWL_03180 [Candidatus Brocadiia bacterium]